MSKRKLLIVTLLITAFVSAYAQTAKDAVFVSIYSTTPQAQIFVDDVERGTDSCVIKVMPGTYVIRAERKGWHDQELKIFIGGGKEQTVFIPAMEQIFATLELNFKPYGSTVYINDEKRGVTPLTLKLPVEIYGLRIEKDGYDAYKAPVTLREEGEVKVVSGQLNRTGSSTISSEDESETDNVPVNSIKNTNTNQVKNNNTVQPSTEVLPPTCGYIQAVFQVGTLMAIGGSVGAYISNFNIEAFYMMGLSKSEDIYWNRIDDSSVMCSYKPTAFGMRIGYGIPIGSSFRMTPQVGATAISIKCDDGDSKGNATSATLSLRADYAVAPHFQLFATPEFDFAVIKSDVYQQLIDVSSIIKSWANGFNVRLGFSVYF